MKGLYRGLGFTPAGGGGKGAVHTDWIGSSRIFLSKACLDPIASDHAPPAP